MVKPLPFNYRTVSWDPDTGTLQVLWEGGELQSFYGETFDQATDRAKQERLFRKASAFGSICGLPEQG